LWTEELAVFKQKYEHAYMEDLAPTEPIYPEDLAELANTQAPVEME
jgi:hypothetical protein